MHNEQNNILGPNVLKNLFSSINILLKCSNSGKFSKLLQKQFLIDIISPNVANKAIIINLWSGGK